MSIKSYGLSKALRRKEGKKVKLEKVKLKKIFLRKKKKEFYFL